MPITTSWTEEGSATTTWTEEASCGELAIQIQGFCTAFPGVGWQGFRTHPRLKTLTIQDFCPCDVYNHETPITTPWTESE